MQLWLKIIICVLVVEILGSLGAILTIDSLTHWYPALKEPPGTPPTTVFRPVWMVLYALIGTSFALVWHRGEPGPAKRTAIAWFVFQMILNVAWTPVFFGFHQLLPALGIIVTLVIAIGVTILCFRRVDRLAASLLVPYLLWVSYATYLNGGFLVLNR